MRLSVPQRRGWRRVSVFLCVMRPPAVAMVTVRQVLEESPSVTARLAGLERAASVGLDTGTRLGGGGDGGSDGSGDDEVGSSDG